MQRRKGKHEEVMLIPFLDILCSLIGILILIIVVLGVANTQQTNGRKPEELAIAQKYAGLSKQLVSVELEKKLLKTKITNLETQQDEAIKKQTRLTELKKRLNLTGAEAATNKDQAAKLQKQIEDLLLQIGSITFQIPPIQKEIDELKSRLAFLAKKPDEKPLPVVIQPSGTGQGWQKKIFFVETSNGTITLRKDRVTKQNIGTGTLVSDEKFNDFLVEIRKTPNAMLIFLIRQDGAASYNLAAGLAQSKYGILTGKLPIPGAGEVDLNMFYKN